MVKFRFNTASFIFVLASFYLLIVVMVWQQINLQLSEERNKTVASAVRHHNNLVFALEQNTVKTLQEAEVVLRLAKNDVEKYGVSVSLDQLLKQGINQLAVFDGLAIIDSSGRIVNSYPSILKNQEANFLQREYFKIQQTADDTLYISKPILSTSLKQPVIVVSRRINDKSGKFMGVVALQILPSRFMAFYKEATINKFDILSLISLDGITYSRRTGDVESNSENISKSPLFQKVKQKAVGSYFANDAIRNIPSYFSYRKLKQYPVIATVGSSENELLSSFFERKKREYTFGFILTILLLTFCVFVFVNFLHRRRTIRSLVSNEAKYRSIFNGSRDAIILLDQNGNIEAINDAGKTLFKLSPLLTELHFSQLFVVSDSFQTFYVALSENQEFTFERRDGTKFIGETATSSFEDGEKIQKFLLLIRNVSAKKRMERQLARERKKHQLDLTKNIITAQENEREIIGRDLHDNVNQVLTTVKLYLETAVASDENRDTLMKHAIKYVSQSINEIRNLSHNLTAPTLGTHSLVDSIKILAESVKIASNVDVELETENFDSSISKEQSLALYRIVQEQLSNIIKHSGCNRVSVLLFHREGEIRLVIQDNGKGFTMSDGKKGIGLRNMESRALAFGGKFSIESAPGKGCTVEVSLPKIEHTTEKESWR